VTVTPLGEDGFMAHCEPVRATALGGTTEEAMANLREAIKEMVQEFGEAKVFEGVNPATDVQVLELAV
jgi:predicted RNase H-like HicB family nuclease